MGLAGIALGVSGSFVWLAIVSTLARLFVYGLSIAALPKAERPGAGRLGADRRRRSPSASGRRRSRNGMPGRCSAGSLLAGLRALRRSPAVRPARAPPPRSPRSSRRRARGRPRRAPPPGRARRHIRASRNAPTSPSNRAGTGFASERTLAVSPSRCPSPSQLIPLEPRRAHRQRRLRPDHDAPALRLQPQHVERLGLAADLQPAALADGEVDQAPCAPSTRPSRSTISPGHRRLGPHLLHHRAHNRRRGRSRCPGCRACRRRRAPARARSRAPPAWACRPAESADNRAGRGSSRTGNSSGRAPDRRRGAAPPRSAPIARRT